MNKTASKFACEVRECGVRIVFDHERDRPSRWATVGLIAEKICCVAWVLHEWVKKAEIDGDKRSDVPAEVAGEVSALEREVSGPMQTAA